MNTKSSLRVVHIWHIGLRSQWAYLIINVKFYLAVGGHTSDGAHGNKTSHTTPTLIPYSPYPTTPTHCFLLYYNPFTTLLTPYPPQPPGSVVIPTFLYTCHSDWFCTREHWSLIFAFCADVLRTRSPIFIIYHFIRALVNVNHSVISDNCFWKDKGSL